MLNATGKEMNNNCKLTIIINSKYFIHRKYIALNI